MRIGAGLFLGSLIISCLSVSFAQPAEDQSYLREIPAECWPIDASIRNLTRDALVAIHEGHLQQAKEFATKALRASASEKNEMDGAEVKAIFGTIYFTEGD